MDYIKIEKALSAEIFEIIIALSELSKKDYRNGEVYTLFSKIDKKIF